MDAVGYLSELQALLPEGPAWSREPDAELNKLLAALAHEFARLDRRGADLLAEADPRTSVELLDDWERNLGLPDPCTAASVTLAARQVAAFQKLSSLGGQTPAFYRAVALALGYDVEIIEFDPDVGTYDGALDVSGGKWRLVWRVNVLTSIDYSVFRVGDSSVGDRLVEGGAADLECIINRLKPAHSHVVFTYPED